MRLLAYIIHWAFTAYTVLLLVRVVGSWFPSFARHPFMYWVFRVTEPYLGAFRRAIPPIGGVLDLSPLLGFFVLQMAEQSVLFLLQWISR